MTDVNGPKVKHFQNFKTFRMQEPQAAYSRIKCLDLTEIFNKVTFTRIRMLSLYPLSMLPFVHSLRVRRGEERGKGERQVLLLKLKKSEGQKKGEGCLRLLAKVSAKGR